MKRFGLGVGAFVLGLTLLELGLRALGYWAPNWHRLDSQLGWALRPNKYGVINAGGFRDSERFLDKPAGVYRIAVLGDERSEALDTRLGQTWWWRLGGQLEACGFQHGKEVEVLNFGVGGYSTAQEAVMLESAAMRYRPDLVLVQFSDDDVADNSFSLAKNKLRPFFILDQRGVARIDESFSFDPSFDRFMQTRYQLGVEIADHSRVFQLARQLPDLLSLSPAHAAPRPQTSVRDATWEDAWRVTEQILAHMNDYSKRNGARMALAAVDLSGYAQQRLMAVGRREAFPVIALAGPFSHAAAAETIARSLCASRSSDVPGGAP